MSIYTRMVAFLHKMKAAFRHHLHRRLLLVNNIPTIGWCFLLILFGYAVNEIVYPFFSNEGKWFVYPSGNKYWLTNQIRVKGWTDLILQICKNAAICLLIKEYLIKAAWFFYILFWYSVTNLAFYWYDYSQLKMPFYVMFVCLCVAAWKLWPRGGKVVRM